MAKNRHQSIKKQKPFFHKKRQSTRRIKQVGGGKRSLLPFAGTPKVGELIAFPSQESHMLKDMAENWDFFMVDGHGISLPTEYKKVPDETYIIFNAPAGCSAYGEAVPFSDTLVTDSEALFLMNLRRDHKRAIERIHAVMNKKPFVDKDFLLRTLAPSEREELKSTCVYPPKFYEKGVNASRAVCREVGIYSAKTIYGPGESYPNLEISFRNKIDFNLNLLGAYKLPIPTEIINSLNAEANHYKKDFKLLIEMAKKGELDHEQAGVLMKAVSILDKMFFGATGVYKDLNYAYDLIGTKTTLDEVLKRLPKLDSTKSRFIFVTACRNVAAMPSKPISNVGKIATLMRQASVETEEAAVAKYKEETMKAAKEYYTPAAAGAAVAAAPVAAAPVAAAPVAAAPVAAAPAAPAPTIPVAVPTAATGGAGTSA